MTKAKVDDKLLIEAERIEAERIEAERIEAERIEAERIEAERIEAERIEAERIEAERIEAERIAAEAAAAEQPEAAVSAVAAIYLEGIETLLSGGELMARVKEGATWLIFANHLHSIPGVAAMQTGPDDWRAEGQRLIFAGDFTVTVNDQARGDMLAVVALADGPDGPVLALCNIAGEITLRTGQSFRFGPGSFVFG